MYKYDEYMKLVEPDKYGNLIFDYGTMQWCKPVAEEELKPEPKKRKKKKRRKTDTKVRYAVLERDNHRCVMCGSEESLQVHHIQHREHGGTDDMDNLVTLCAVCHMHEHKGEPVYNLMVTRV